MYRHHSLFVLIPLFAVTVIGCGASTSELFVSADRMPALSPVPLEQEQLLRVVATTSIVGDVVRNIGGEWVDLTVLLPSNSDPHAFEPTPQDVAMVAEAHVVFANGAGLEVFLERLLESAGGADKAVPVSYSVELLQVAGEHEGGASEEGYRRGEFDPHTWFDPYNVMIWADNIAFALGSLDPANAAGYQSNAADYKARLQLLDEWIREQVDQVPAADRRLVTDHTTFTYFVHRYGFEQVGAVFPGYSTLAQPSAQELADLEQAIRAQGSKVVFVGKTVNPSLAQQVAQDTGTQLVFLYTGSLSEPGGPADSYESLMRYDVSMIVQALR